jgi:hypothetical protein
VVRFIFTFYIFYLLDNIKYCMVYVQNINMSSCCFFTGLLIGSDRILLSGVARLQIYSHRVVIYAFDGGGHLALEVGAGITFCAPANIIYK